MKSETVVREFNAGRLPVLYIIDRANWPVSFYAGKVRSVYDTPPRRVDLEPYVELVLEKNGDHHIRGSHIAGCASSTSVFIERDEPWQAELSSRFPTHRMNIGDIMIRERAKQGALLNEYLSRAKTIGENGPDSRS